MRLWVVVTLAGCGRIAFDPQSLADARDAATADVSTVCVDDNFNAGANNWTPVAGTGQLQPVGPDNSLAFQSNVVGGPNVFRAPNGTAITTVAFSADFYVNEVNGDFNVILSQPGYDGTYASLTGYDFGMFPVGGDTTPDAIGRWQAGSGETLLAMHALSLAVRTWHHIDVQRDSAGSMTFAIDSAPYLTAVDSTIAPPYDLVVRFWGVGYLDNVHVDCAR